jgi:hypothetical protein
MVIGVWPDGKLYFQQSSNPPADGMMTAAERRDFARLLNASGALAALVSPARCGPDAADYTEFLTTGVTGGHVTKQNTNCHQSPYEELRQFLFGLRDAHFHWATGTCPAPNVWRYMSAGCGAEAHPVCGTSVGDACAADRCSCDGRDIIGCDFTSEPYAYVGRCHGDGGGGQ